MLIGIGNSGDKALLPQALSALDHESALVRGMAVWACARLMDGTSFMELARERLTREEDEDVRAEWTHELTLGERA